MKKLLCVAALLLALPSCAWVQDQACTGTSAMRDTVFDGLSYVPVVGPWSGEITNLLFDMACTLIGGPESVGRDLEERVGLQLDPTATEGTDEATAEDPGT